ncbi:F-box/kelch-repeat protein, partial [Trifolium medium]|nr:F-box/kelch-repeat protein [Trifolium medium]
MEPSSKNDVPIDVVVSSLSHTEETTSIQLTPSTETLTSSSPLPTLPFDLIAEILCRLPVKLLLPLQRDCKSWKSLISDPNFAKKYLRKSTPRHHLMISVTNNKLFILWVHILGEGYKIFHIIVALVVDWEY